ncbi:hypothetical protein R6Q59_017183 [Mikania micrantha]
MDRSITSLEMVEERQNPSEFLPKHIRFVEIRADEDEDRISKLPDCLLVEILSRLPATKCAVITGALSKRWKHIWTSVPNLIFSHHGDPSGNFISFVDKILIQRGQLKLKSLIVYSTYDDRFESQVHNWIRYALNCNVEEINMFFWHTKRQIMFLLDQCFFTNSYFTDLNLTFCQINPAGAIRWEKLLSLHVSNVNLDEDLIENILSGSPVLETLVLNECFGFRRLNITSKSVKKLVFDGCFANADVIEINAPNILSLEIVDYLYLRKILLINVSSLVEADLDYALRGEYEMNPKEAEEEMLKRFITNLVHVKEVKIGVLCFKALSRLEAKGFIFPSNLNICDVSYYPFESDSDSLELSDRTNSDSDETRDSEMLLLDDGPTGEELQERVDAITSSSFDDDEADA